MHAFNDFDGHFQYNVSSTPTQNFPEPVEIFTQQNHPYSTLLPFVNQDLQTPHNNKGPEHMSLILTLQNKNGIVFCGDSKSTSDDSLHYPTQEIGRDCYKVFQAPKIIVATFGRNRLLRNHILVPIEMIIDSILTKNPEIEVQDFFESAHQDSLETLVYDNSAPTNFIVGYKKDGKYFVEHRSFSHGSYQSNIYYNTTISYFGILHSCPRNVFVNENWSLDEMKTATQAIMESAIKLGDIFFNYNPIGGKIRFATLQ